ncbi:MAG: TRAP transporter large permease [Firmicutes bacterium]|nr:TRAP transporter large permease [Bacillota bacterium]
MNATWIFIIVFVVLLLAKLPVPIAVGVSCIVGLLNADISAQLLITSSVKTLNSFTLLAVPFFILAGNIMTRGSIAAKLLYIAKAFLGDRKEAIGIATIVACAFFAALSGSSTATCAALGPLVIPMMKSEGYKTRYAAAIVAAGAMVGPIIPPSIIMCVYGVNTNTSISDLFTAGIIPGLLLSGSFVVALMITKKMDNNIDFAHVNTEVSFTHKLSLKEKLLTLWDGKWALLMPIIVLGGIYSGIVTPAESAVIACVYVLIVSCFIEREMRIKDVLESFRVTINTMGGLMILLGMSTVFGNVLTMNRVPEMITEAILGLTHNPILIMLGINVILLIAGCFMEAAACITIFTPMLLPLAIECGQTPLTFGILMCVNLVIGTITPPFGLSLYMTSSITKEPVFGIAKKVIPFIISSVVVLMLITYVPQIITFLPTVLG